MKTLRIEHSPASRVRVLRLPGWPREPIVEGRQDGRDTITLSVLAANQVEEWKFVLLRGGVLTVISYVTSRPDTLPVVRRHFEMGLCIPPDMVGHLQIDRTSPRRGETPWRTD